MSDTAFVIRNEFAIVEVSLARRGTGDVLRLRDLAGDAELELDALELEGLCSFGPDVRQRLRDPEWRMTDEPEMEGP